MKVLILVKNNNIFFFSEENKIVSFINSSPLFFYFDKIKNKFTNSAKFKLFFLEENKNTFSNLLLNFSENKSIDNPIAKNYSFFIEKIFSEVINKFPNYENIELIFSDSCSSKVKNKLSIFLSSKYKLSEKTYLISDIAAKNYILKKQITSNLENIVILDSSDQNLSVSNVKFNNQIICSSFIKKFDNFIFKPSAYSISETIINDISRIYNLNIDNNTKQKFITYIYLKIQDKTLEIENLPKNFAVISTKLPNYNERFTVRIDTSKIKLLKQVYLKRIINSLSSNFYISNKTHLILVGEIFENEELNEYLQDNFSHVEYLTHKDILKTRNEDFSSTSDEFSTMFLETSPETNEDSESETISTLDITDLNIGQQIKLTNYDSRPNKGYSTQLLESLGLNKFVVIESTRSLKTGDIIETDNNIWHSGIKLIFNVHRNGKLYGRFQSREIQKIEVLLKKS